jgi:hypothetical protein
MEETTPSVTTRSAGLTFGLYSAVVSILVFVVLSALGMNPFSGGWNYVGTVAAIVLLVLAQKNFKDNGNGFMSYGQGFGIGFWFGLAGVLLGVGFMYVYVEFIDHGPLDAMMAEQLEKMQEQGAPDSTIETAQEWTKKLFWPLALAGGLVGNLVIAAIVTIFTQKANPEMPV